MENQFYMSCFGLFSSISQHSLKIDLRSVIYMNKRQALDEVLQKNILLMDGAMGTMIQRHKLTEEDYRGQPFKDWHLDIKGGNDILNITQPHIIAAIHQQYVDAGADIIETNTFNAQRISMADYQMEDYVTEINVAATQVALGVAQKANRKIWVAGAVGPMNKMLSLSPDVQNPAARGMTFDEAMSAYKEQMLALIHTGVDILLIETIFDTLNAKAAIVAAKTIFREQPEKEIPIMISGTITDNSGRTLSGQTPLAFLISVLHAQPLCVGLNCALGAKAMTPFLEELSKNNPTYTSVYPNAGLPNELGQYEQTPEQMAQEMKPWLEHHLVNVIGGCCGTTPEHIKALKELSLQYKPIQKQR